MPLTPGLHLPLFSHSHVLPERVHGAGIPQLTSAKPAPRLDMARFTPAWCGATLSGGGEDNERSEQQSGERQASLLPSCRLLPGASL
uniref:Uncharacterized protein n=1 Tax=Aquila chrysaetos chrysaetos TaxID=223781 RepID=A0A663EEB8_AQUCH